MDDKEDQSARAAKRRKIMKDASAAAYRRGLPIATRKIEDKKLKGKLRYSEK